MKTLIRRLAWGTIRFKPGQTVAVIVWERSNRIAVIGTVEQVIYMPGLVAPEVMYQVKTARGTDIYDTSKVGKVVHELPSA